MPGNQLYRHDFHISDQNRCEHSPANSVRFAQRSHVDDRLFRLHDLSTSCVRRFASVQGCQRTIEVSDGTDRNNNGNTDHTIHCRQLFRIPLPNGKRTTILFATNVTTDIMVRNCARIHQTLFDTINTINSCYSPPVKLN